MPTNAGAGSLPYTVAILIGTYSDWLARTLKRGTQPSQGHGQSQGQLLVPQLLQLLMQRNVLTPLSVPCRALGG